MLAAGVCFIVPAALMVTALARPYVEKGTTPAFDGLLYGMVPVVLAIVARAVVGLAPTVLRSRLSTVIAVAAVAIFAPSFVFVGLLTRLTGWLRGRRWTAAALDGLGATSVALMAGVLARLAGDGLVDLVTLALFGLTLLGLWRTRWNSAWFIVAGGATGVLLTWW
nr:chromate transporter [Nocardioides sambongensis]